MNIDLNVFFSVEEILSISLDYIRYMDLLYSECGDKRVDFDTINPAATFVMAYCVSKIGPHASQEEVCKMILKLEKDRKTELRIKLGDLEPVICEDGTVEYIEKSI